MYVHIAMNPWAASGIVITDALHIILLLAFELFFEEVPHLFIELKRAEVAAYTVTPI